MSTVTIYNAAAGYNMCTVYPRSMYNNTGGDLIRDVSIEHKIRMCRACGAPVVGADKCPQCGSISIRNPNCAKVFAVINNTREAYLKTLADTQKPVADTVALAA